MVPPAGPATSHPKIRSRPRVCPAAADRRLRCHRMPAARLQGHDGLTNRHPRSVTRRTMSRPTPAQQDVLRHRALDLRRDGLTFDQILSRLHVETGWRVPAEVLDSWLSAAAPPSPAPDDGIPPELAIAIAGASEAVRFAHHLA